MAAKAEPLGLLPVLLAFLLLAGLITAAYFEFLTDPVVDRVSAGATNNVTLTFVTAKSRVFRRPLSRLVMIEGKGAVRDHYAWIWGHSPQAWVGTECVLLSDAVGIRPCSSRVFRELWKLESQPLGINMLRQVAAETRDPDLIQFLARNQP